jgi:HAD superfamily hydrolase (TIGR01509 family)
MAEPPSARSIDAVIFDMDGVLIDSEPVHQHATDEVARQFGLPPVDQDTFVRHFFGRTDYTGFLDYLVAVQRTDLSIPDLMEATVRAYARRFPAEVQPFPDALETLRACVARGYRVAIVSGARNSELDDVVKRFDLAPLLDAIVGGDDVPVGKPDPAPYLAGARELGLPPERCLVIEDAPAGVASAVAAGMRCLAVDRTGHPELLFRADRVVNTVTIDAIEALARRRQ